MQTSLSLVQAASPHAGPSTAAPVRTMPKNDFARFVDNPAESLLLGRKTPSAPAEADVPLSPGRSGSAELEVVQLAETPDWSGGDGPLSTPMINLDELAARLVESGRELSGDPRRHVGAGPETPSSVRIGPLAAPNADGPLPDGIGPGAAHGRAAADMTGRAIGGGQSRHNALLLPEGGGPVMSRPHGAAREPGPLRPPEPVAIPSKAPAQTGEDAPGRGDGTAETAVVELPQEQHRRRTGADASFSERLSERPPSFIAPGKTPAKVDDATVETGRSRLVRSADPPPASTRRMGPSFEPVLITGAAPGGTRPSASPAPTSATSPDGASAILQAASTPPATNAGSTTAGVPSWAGATPVAREAALADWRYTADHGTANRGSAAAAPPVVKASITGAIGRQPAGPTVTQAPSVPEAELFLAGTIAPDPATGASVTRAIVAPAIQAAPVLQQLTAAVHVSGLGVTEIRLDPVELGRVTLTLASGETGITVSVVADRPETADLIRRHLDSLSSELRQIGYGSVSYNFTNSGFGSGADRGQAAAAAEASAAEPDTEQIIRAGADRKAVLTPDGALDIRM